MTDRRPLVLLVDDDEAAVALLAEVLERERYQVVTATSVPLALRDRKSVM